MTTKTKSRKGTHTTDAVEILHRRYFSEKPEKLILLEAERGNAAIARQIYALRERANLTQRELARLVGTTASVICRLEDADYEGHSLAMLRRIAGVLDKRLEIRFVSVQTRARDAAKRQAAKHHRKHRESFASP